MKILHCYKTYLPDTIGGVEQVINQIAKGAASHGVNSEVFTLSPNKSEPELKIDGHVVHRCHTHLDIASTPFSFSAFKAFKKIAKNADIIHYHFPYPFADMLHFACRIKKPTIVTYHSDIIKQKHLLKLYQPLMHKFLNGIDRIVATSPNYLNSSIVLSKYQNKTVIIPIGIADNTRDNIDDTKIKYWQKRLGNRFFLFIGVLRYYKGLHILIEATRNNSFPIAIVGAGPYEQELKAMANKYNLKNIHFLGKLTDQDKNALLKLSYAVIFPSHLRSEAFGITLIEGAMHSKPLISCEIGTGTTYINIDNKTGKVVPPNDPLALHHAMQYLWQNPAEAHKLGQNANVRYQDLFTAKAMVDSYVKLYEELL